ncbi:hypothetical protein H0266_12275 [Halobacillus locisalis]|uniref:Uncharacterized protein n=1 Tax=Halobacillus locisalis TaxID=220753 RepID=A0A838CUT1_9BACI|nr:hypothetical protein [Halobacillus locisalis]MBA2175668.1 hypothetical protein [Halobacillus locisalis]
MKAKFITSLALASIITVAGCSQEESGQQESEQQGGSDVSLQEVTESFDGTLQHVHGMGIWMRKVLRMLHIQGSRFIKTGIGFHPSIIKMTIWALRL